MKRRHSLSTKLILLFVVMAVLIALTMRSGFRYGIQDQLRSLAEPHLLEYIRHLHNEIGDPPDYPSAQALAERLSLEIHSQGPQNAWSTSGTIPDLSSFRFHSHKSNGDYSIEVGRDEHRLVIRLSQGERHILLIPQRLSHGPQVPLAILLTISLVLGLIALAYYLVKRLFRPIQAIREGVNRFGSGELDHRIQTRRRDELGELTTSINIMADDLQQMLEAKRQLLLAISHELRSPLTRARVNAELLEPTPGREKIIADLKEMEEQLTELLETERLENRHSKLDLSANSPSDLIAMVMQQHFPDIPFQLQQENNDAYLSLDPVRIRLLIKNLLENALHHTPEGEELPIITSRIDAAGWSFSVRDHGTGIPPEHLPHLTEPFYRVDKARQRDTGGYGLGLYLCRVIAEAHGGELRITSALGDGSEVTFSLPVAQTQIPD